MEGVLGFESFGDKIVRNKIICTTKRVAVKIK